jgi:hypothetical protein
VLVEDDGSNAAIGHVQRHCRPNEASPNDARTLIDVAVHAGLAGVFKLDSSVAMSGAMEVNTGMSFTIFK